MNPQITRTNDRQGPSLAGLPCLVALHGQHRGQAWWLDQPLLVLGRDPECAVCLDDDSVSRRHAELRRHADEVWLLADLGSKNGTRLNDRVLSQATALGDGDLLSIGAITLQFLLVQSAHAEPASGAHISLRAGSLKLEPAHCTVWVGARSAVLTETECQLLAALLRRPGRVLSVPALMRAAWPDQSTVASATVTSHLRNLRHKLSSLTDGDDPIRSYYGRGYALQV